MRFIVYGAGAVGGVVGAQAEPGGVRRPAGRARCAPRGDHGGRVAAGDTAGRPHGAGAGGDARSADLDVDDDTAVLVTVKGQHTADVIEDLAAHVPDTTTVVSVQNGVANERALLRSFEHVLGVTVMLPSSHLSPGVVIQNSDRVPGMLDVGVYPHGVDERCEAFAAAVRAAGFESVVRDDVMAWKHRKLISNLGNGVQASCAPGEDADALTALVRREGEAVLATAGIAVVTAEADAERRGDLLSPGAIGGRGGGSTWQSLERGAGSVEVDYLNGEICLQARLHGVRAPANDLVRRTTKRLAREGSPAGHGGRGRPPRGAHRSFLITHHTRANPASPAERLLPVGLGQDRQHRGAQVERVVVAPPASGPAWAPASVPPRGPGRRGRRSSRGGRHRGLGDRGGRLGSLLGGLLLATAQTLLDARDELPEQLVGDVLHHAAAELRRLAGDRQVGDHDDVGVRRRCRSSWRSRWRRRCRCRACPCPWPRSSSSGWPRPCRGTCRSRCRQGRSGPA